MEFQQQQQQGGWQNGAKWAGAGALGYGAVNYGMQVAKDAKLAKIVSIGTASVALLGGNAALTNANTAMATINSIDATATPTPAISASYKSAMQQLAQAIQNLSFTGYLGVSQSTAPVTTAAAGTAAAASNNLGGLALIALAVVLLK